MNLRASLFLALVLLYSPNATAQYAEPPDQRGTVWRHSEPPPPDYPPPAMVAEDPRGPGSLVRVHAGPAVRFSEYDPQLGALAALEIGRRAAGFRATGAWIQAGSVHGISQYTGEFWLDLCYGERWHPIIGVGAGLARVGTLVEAAKRTETVGIGVLRAGLEVELPVRDTDARASLEALGSLPVAKPEHYTDAAAWGVLLATVGVGF